MTSRRLRKRGDKRRRWSGEPSPELMRILEEPAAREPDTIETHAGPVDLRKPWPMPEQRKDAA